MLNETFKSHSEEEIHLGKREVLQYNFTLNWNVMPFAL